MSKRIRGSIERQHRIKDHDWQPNPVILNCDLQPYRDKGWLKPLISATCLCLPGISARSPRYPTPVFKQVSQFQSFQVSVLSILQRSFLGIINPFSLPLEEAATITQSDLSFSIAMAFCLGMMSVHLDETAAKVTLLSGLPLIYQ